MKKNIVKVALVAVVGLIAGINVFNAQKTDVLSDIALANVEALADVEDTGGEYGCGGNPTFIRNKTLKTTFCPPLWLGGSHLKCKSEDNVCCNPSEQTDCKSIL